MNIHDLSTDERARALVALSSRWNEMVDALTGIPGFGDEMIRSTLNATLGSYAHPLLDRDHLDDLLIALREASSHRDTYNTYGFLPDHIDEKFGPHYSAEDVEQALDDDINAALFPLLTAFTIPCTECKRTRWDVTTWEAPKPNNGLRCDDHRLVLAVSA